MNNSILEYGMTFLGILLISKFVIVIIGSFILLRKIKYNLISSIIVSVFMVIPFCFELLVTMLSFLKKSSLDVVCFLGGVDSQEFIQRIREYKKEMSGDR